MAFLCLSSLGAGGSAAAATRLRVSPRGELAAFWQVRRADIREKLTETMGYLEVKNVTGSTLTGSVIYAEYFDAAGRFCFSLLFQQKRNLQGKRSAAAGEVLVLYSGSGGLFPAAQPWEARLYLVQQSASGEPSPPHRWGVPFRVPVTLDGGVAPDAAKLLLPAEASRARTPLLDLALVRVTVDEEGFVDGVEVLGAADREAESWLLDFVRQLTFYPAANGGLPTTEDALLMVRAILPGNGLGRAPSAPRLSPWVRGYVAGLGGAEVPPVTVVAFGPPPTMAKLNGSEEWTTLPPAPPGLFELELVGSYWSDLATNLVRDWSMAHHYRRVLVLPDARQ